MQVKTEKVTLSLDRKLLEKMARRAKKTRSAFVRDLIQREAEQLEEITLSPEILELKGSLKLSNETTKARVPQTAKKRLKKNNVP